jgi:branched-chain amino acid aminotransferase
VEKLVRAQGLQFTQREIDRTELYLADEVMLCGTLAEILPVTSIDRIQIGDGTPGPVVRRLQQQYDQLVGVLPS